MSNRSTGLGYTRKTPEERFWPKVDVRQVHECWEWKASFTGWYGIFNMSHLHGDQDSAHRASWRLNRGPIPDGMFVLHRCDNPKCVNPGHLFLGTQLDNMRDRNSKGRQPLGEKSNCTNLTEDMVREIRSLDAHGLRREVNAAIHGITVSGLQAIVCRRHWSHVQ